MAPYPRRHVPAHLRDPNYKTGRPSLYRQEYCEQVINFMATGRSLTAFAGSIRVSLDAVYDWIRVHPEFSEAVSRARPARVKWLEDKLLKSRKGAETTAAIFALKNAAPYEWRDQKYTQVNQNVKIEKLTDEQLDLLIAGADPSTVGIIEPEYQDVTHDATLVTDQSKKD